MKKLILTISAVIVFIFNLKSQSDTTFFEVYFKKGKWNISETEYKKIADINSTYFYTLSGYTDAESDSITNYNLSVKRVKTIEDILVNKGISKEHINTYYLGESGNNKDDVYSRRVEILGYEKNNDLNLNEEQSYISDTVVNQRYVINTKNESTIVCAEGTKILIKAGTFKEDSVLLEVKEFYDMDDIILNNLATVSDGNLLETKGMLYLNATSKGLDVKPTIPIEISMKNNEDTLNKDYKIFNGNVDSKNNINWKVDSMVEISKSYTTSIYKRLSCGVSKYRIKNYIDKYIRSSRTNGFKEEFYKCRDYTYGNHKLKTYFSIDEDGYITALDKNYVIEDSLINKGKRKVIIGKTKRFCYDFYMDIITSLSPLPEKIQPKYKITLVYDQNKDLDIINNSKSIKVKDTTIYYTQNISYLDNEKLKKLQESYNTFSTTKLGWINCDRFIREGYDKSGLITLKVNNTDDLNMVLITKKSMMNANYMENSATFNNIPKDLNIKIVAYKKLEDNTYSFTNINTKASENIIELSKPELLSSKEFFEKLKSFN